MTVFLGCSGRVELKRSAEDAGISATLRPSDVNATRNRFSFDFELGQFLTGDLVEIRSTDGTDLSFINASGWPSGSQYTDGRWFLFVDDVGGIYLYTSYDKSLAGEATGRVDLLALNRNLPITMRVINTTERILGQVSSYEFNTERQAVDVTSLSEDFRQQYSGLISGSGRVQCLFDYKFKTGDPSYPSASKDYELPRYMNELVLRTKVGSEFTARLYLVTPGANSYNDEVYYEIDAVITNAGMTFTPGELISASFDFVTTGRIGFRVKTTGGYLLQENQSKVKLEANQSGFVALED